jgi:hypothetical protein
MASRDQDYALSLLLQRPHRSRQSIAASDDLVGPQPLGDTTP